MYYEIMCSFAGMSMKMTTLSVTSLLKSIKMVCSFSFVNFDFSASNFMHCYLVPMTYYRSHDVQENCEVVVEQSHSAGFSQVYLINMVSFN